MSFEVPPQPRCSLSCPCPWLSSAPIQLLVWGLPECVGTRTPSPGSSLSARVAVPPEDFRILCYGFILGLGFCFHVPGQDRKGTTGEGSVEGSEGESRHRGCGVSFPGDDQNPPGFDPAQPARGEPALAGPGVDDFQSPFQPNPSVTLCRGSRGVGSAASSLLFMASGCHRGGSRWTSAGISHGKGGQALGWGQGGDLAQVGLGDPGDLFQPQWCFCLP